MRTIGSKELVERDRDGRLFVVVGMDGGRYELHAVTLVLVGTYDRKWMAKRAVEEDAP